MSRCMLIWFELSWATSCFISCPTVMSGNSADSFSEDSEAEEEKEEVKEKPEVMVKKKGPGRPPRKKRAPVASPVSPSIPNVHKRRCIPPKSGNSQRLEGASLIRWCTVFTSSFSHREAWSAEATLVGGGACSSGDSPEEKPHWAARSCKGRLWTLPRTLPPAGQQPARLEGDQVLRPQPHPAAEEAGQEGKRRHGLLEQKTKRWHMGTCTIMYKPPAINNEEENSWPWWRAASPSYLFSWIQYLKFGAFPVSSLWS